MTDKKAIFEQIKELVITFEAEQVISKVREALEQGVSGKEILANGLIEGLQYVGEKFEKREFFLPELMMSADLMNQVMVILKPEIAGNDSIDSEGRIVLGTVQGDIHDIGKSIVGALLQASGFEVTDVGVDVPPEKFASEAKAVKADVVAISCLLSTGISKLTETTFHLKNEKVDALVIIGGAAVNEKVADMVGADLFASDAWQAVGVIKNGLKKAVE